MVPAAQAQFCATYDDDATPEDCSFTTMQMCQQSVDGIGGYCAPQAEAPAVPPPPLFQFNRGPDAFAPAPMPPPPLADQTAPPAQAPMQLPDASPNNQ
jgi:hypothetical protein